MSITPKDVQYVAGLSRIHVPADKLEAMAKSLDSIVHYVEQLQTLNVDNVKPTSHAIPMANALRDDVVKPSLSNQEALSIAPAAQGGSFKVPLVIE